MLRDHTSAGIQVEWSAASALGGRRVNADALAVHRDEATGAPVFALADGVGDDQVAALAARTAAEAAAQASVVDGPIQAILTAQRALPVNGGDCVLVVAMPFTDRTSAGYRIAWVGDCRAYAWGGMSPRPLTLDQTLAQYFRSRHQSTTARMEHVVINSVRTTTVNQVGWTQVRVAGSGLLLTTDGVHKSVPTATMHRVLTTEPDPATSLTEVAQQLGGRDNASVIVVDWTCLADPAPVVTVPYQVTPHTALDGSNTAA